MSQKIVTNQGGCYNRACRWTSPVGGLWGYIYSQTLTSENFNGSTDLCTDKAKEDLVKENTLGIGGYGHLSMSRGDEGKKKKTRERERERERNKYVSPNLSQRHNGGCTKNMGFLGVNDENAFVSQNTKGAKIKDEEVVDFFQAR